MFEEISDRLPAEALRRRDVPAGTSLFLRGDPVRSIHFVQAGLAELVRHTPDGKPAILQRAGPGEMLAEASVFSAHYHCDAVAAAPSAIVTIARPVFLELLAVDTAFAVRWMTHLARQVQAARLRSEILTLKTVAERLDAWLAFNDGRLPGKGARLGLAREIGVSPEALYREIARRRET